MELLAKDLFSDYEAPVSVLDVLQLVDSRA
jgi:hypothetical protein